MTEEELREKIAGLIQDNSNKIIENVVTGAGIPTKTWTEISAEILTIIKEALPELAKEAGYVKLANNQTLPKNPWEEAFEVEKSDRLQCIANYALAQQIMLKAVWRKVILEEKNGS